MDLKITTIAAKATIPVLRGIHWFYLLKQENRWKKYMDKFPWKFTFVGLVIIVSYLFFSFYIPVAQSDKKFMVNVSQLEIQNIPKWLTKYEKSILPIGLADELSIFDKDITSRIATAYYENPWVKGITKIRKYYPNHIRASLVLRKPVVYVRQQEIYYLTDKEAIRLPGEYTTRTLPKNTELFILQVEGETVPRPGTTWDNAGVLEMIRVVNYLQKCKLSKVLPIHLAVLKKHKNSLLNQIILETDYGTKVVWGRAFQSFGEIKPRNRVKALIEFMRHPDIQQQYPQLQGVAKIDIRFGYAIVKIKQ